MIHQRLDPFTASQILAVVKPVLQSARSEAELNRRLQARGYGIRSTNGDEVLTAEPHGVPLFPVTRPQF